MHYSTSLNVFDDSIYDCAIDKSLERCKRAGFTRLDLNYWDYLKPLMGKSSAEEATWARAIHASAEEQGMQFTQMHGPVHGRSFSDLIHGLTMESYLSLVERSLQTAAILRIPWVVLHPTNISSNGFEPLQEVITFNCNFFKKILPCMEKLGVGIALENQYDRNPNHQGTLYRNIGSVPEELCEIIDKINHPLVGACWDTGHGHMQGLPQGKSLRTLGNRLKATHIHDNDGKRDQHLLPFYGTIDWQDTMNALHDIRYQGDFTYEAHNAIQVLPDSLRDQALNLAAAIAQNLTDS